MRPRFVVLGLLIGCGNRPPTPPSEPAPVVAATPADDAAATRAATTEAPASPEALEPLDLEPRPIDEARGFVGHSLDPATIDPAVTRDVGPHLTGVRLEGTPRGQLLVVLPGTTTSPTAYTRFLRVALDLGMHTIGLAYPNEQAVAPACRGRPGDCHARVRAEILSGLDLAPEIEMSRADSIEGRLESAVRALARRHPEEGWSVFLDDKELVWERVRVVGQSQGAGHAAMMAARHPVARAVMLAGPADPDKTARVLGEHHEGADWLKAAWATDRQRVFGLVHVDDPAAAKVTEGWRDAGLDRFGEVVLVDLAAPPYGGSHMFVTSLEPAGMSPHASVLHDRGVALAPDGSPLLEPAWRFLIAGDLTAIEREIPAFEAPPERPPKARRREAARTR